MVGISSLFKFIKVLGQISESINKASDGFQWLINFFIIKSLSIGKNWWEIFFNFVLEIIFEELKVFEVINIWEIFFDFSNFSNKGTILWNSPTLAPWNHINFPLFFFFE